MAPLSKLGFQILNPFTFLKYLGSPPPKEKKYILSQEAQLASIRLKRKMNHAVFRASFDHIVQRKGKGWIPCGGKSFIVVVVVVVCYFLLSFITNVDVIVNVGITIMKILIVKITTILI